MTIYHIIFICISMYLTIKSSPFHYGRVGKVGSCVSVEVSIALKELGMKLKHPLIQINFHNCGRVQGSKSRHSKMDSHVRSPKVSQIFELIFGNQTLSNFGFLWTIGKV